MAEIDASNEHPDYILQKKSWEKVRDCLAGEEKIKLEKTKYLPQPEGMKNKYQEAYTSYIERAHFPLISAYALQGALGVLMTKLPEFHLPKNMEYLHKTATKDGRSLHELFLDTIVEIFTCGRRPCLIDIAPKNKFCFVPYKAESFINWKVDILSADQKKIHLAVFSEDVPDDTADEFSHDSNTRQRVLKLNSAGNFVSILYEDDTAGEAKSPNYMGKKLKEIPIVNAGSINNSFETQLIPLLSVANCSIQIYRKEADLANSEFLSCNPTLIFSGVSDDETPNVVGSSVAIYLDDPQARAYYTRTDTQALTHVKTHIEALYDEAIRHGIALLEARKGVEAAEALRIRQSIQVATIYSIYQSSLNMVLEGLKIMCRWQGINENEVTADAPKSLTQEIPDSSLMKEIFENTYRNLLPLETVFKYVSGTGLIDPTVTFDDYKKLLFASKEVLTKLEPKPLKPEGGDTTKKKTDDDDGGTK